MDLDTGANAEADSSVTDSSGPNSSTTDSNLDTDTQYTVSREGRTFVTLHGGTDTTACNDATAQVTDALEGLSDDRITDWELIDTDVSEQPVAPFDPYTIAVEFAVSTSVTADDPETAESLGVSAIDDALEAAGVTAISYSADPVVTGSRE